MSKVISSDLQNSINSMANTTVSQQVPATATTAQVAVGPDLKLPSGSATVPPPGSTSPPSGKPTVMPEQDDQRPVMTTKMRRNEQYKAFSRYADSVWDTIKFNIQLTGVSPDQLLEDWTNDNIRPSTVFIAKMVLTKGTNLRKYCGETANPNRRGVDRNKDTFIAHATALGLKIKKNGAGRSVASCISVLVPFLMERRAKEQNGFHGFKTLLYAEHLSFQGSIAGIPLTQGIPEVYDYCRWQFAYSHNAISYVKEKSGGTAKVPNVDSADFIISYFAGLLKYLPFSLYCWTNTTKQLWARSIAKNGIEKFWHDVPHESNSGIKLWTDSQITDMVKLLVAGDRKTWSDYCDSIPLY